MERLRVKASLGLFVPFECESCPSSTLHPEPNFGFSVLVHSLEQISFTLKLFCKQRVTSAEYEQQDCLCWATRAPLTFIKRADQTGFILRLKVKQGVFDFRKIKKRFIRLQVECKNSAGEQLKIATSEYFQLLPRKRNGDIFDGDNSGVTLPLHWRDSTSEIKNPRAFQLIYSPSGCFTDEEFSVATPYERADTPISDSSVSMPKSYESLSLPSSPRVRQRLVAIKREPAATEDMSDSDAVLHSNEDTPVPADEYVPSSASRQNEVYEVLHEGNAEVVGNFRALNFYKASDVNIKKDIRLLNQDRDPRDVILKINGVEYKFKDNVQHATNKRFVGYIAQQIESVVPSAVQLIDGILHVDYESLIPYLSESIKQNYNDINALRSELYHLKIFIVVLTLVLAITLFRIVTFY